MNKPKQEERKAFGPRITYQHDGPQGEAWCTFPSKPIETDDEGPSES